MTAISDLCTTFNFGSLLWNPLFISASVVGGLLFGALWTVSEYFEKVSKKGLAAAVSTWGFIMLLFLTFVGGYSLAAVSGAATVHEIQWLVAMGASGGVAGLSVVLMFFILAPLRDLIHGLDSKSRLGHGERLDP